MITVREIADNNTTISSTRWAFATTIKIDFVIIIIVLLAGLVCHFIPKVPDLESSFYGSVAMLLGVPTTIIGTAKALQGFEPHNKTDKANKNTEEVKEELPPPLELDK